MKKFLAVAICLLCAFALASGADLVLATERIVTTDPADGKKIEWFWDNGELAAEKTLGHTDMPGGFKARNIAFQTYGKLTRRVALADAIEIVRTGCKIPVFVEGDRRISSFFPFTKKEESFSANLFYSFKDKRFAEEVLAAPNKKYTALELSILLALGAIIIFISLILTLAEANLYFYSGRKYGKPIIFLFLTVIFCYGMPFFLDTIGQPIISIKNLIVPLLLGFLSGTAFFALFYAFTEPARSVSTLIKRGTILGIAYLPAYTHILTEAAIRQYAVFVLICTIIAFFSVLPVFSLINKGSEAIKKIASQPTWRDF